MANPKLYLHNFLALPNQENQSEAGDILKLLVYTAAQIGAGGFIRFIFSSSAGQNVFEAYRNESLLPEHIAEANGHENIAAYIRDITKRYMKFSFKINATRKWQKNKGTSQKNDLA